MFDFLNNVRTTLSRHRMTAPGGRVLVGVSGGPDSLALLSALVALRGKLSVKLHAAYVDHGLRPAAAKKEAARVKEICRRWAVPVHRLTLRIRKGGGESLEAAARQARYEALVGLAQRTGSRAIAVGHTADDQAETVLMWVLRGTGTTGLAGIPPVREVRLRSGKRFRIIRPLLGCSRKEILEYLKAQGVQPLLDRSNLSPRFFRNRIRRDLLTHLERQYNPQVRAHLCRLAEIVREDLGWMRAEADRAFRVVVKLREGRATLDRARLRKAHPALRRALLRLAVERLQGNGHGFRSGHWEQLDRVVRARGSSGMDLPHGFRAEARATGKMVLRRVALSPRRESGRLTLKEGVKGGNA